MALHNNGGESSLSPVTRGLDLERGSLSIFEQAADLDPSEQQVFVIESCGDDAALRQRVFELLAAHEELSGFLEAPHSSEPVEPQAWIGSRLGPYRLNGLLGTGGMGWVFAAEREDGEYQQQVAIKVLPRSSSSVLDFYRQLQLTERMRQERQILARLEHPHIARLLDGGTSDDGRPYLVMEKLVGEPIDRYCRERQLELGPRLRLFLDICSAIQFAHRNLLVHRDIKPSNILVTSDGVVKLLDFGIAKLLEIDAPSGLTATGESPMTLRYASPEQVKSQPLTTACDVYSLGVLLYELLSGTSPYRNFKANYGLQKAICEQEPWPPSRAATEAAPPGQASQLHASQLQPSELRGDLDAIVLKALAKEPAERYPSAEAMADDLRRFLLRLPVRARRSTWAYRLSSFVRRHQVAVSLTALLVLSTLTYAATWAGQARRIQQESETSRLALDFLVDTFRSADATQTGRGMSGTEILDLASNRLDAAFAHRPQIRGTLLQALSEAYLGLSELDRAEQMLSDRQALLDSGAIPALAAEERVRLDRQRATLAYRRAAFPEAARIAREAISRAQQELGQRHDETLKSQEALAIILRDSGQLVEAEALFQQVERELAPRLPESHPRRLQLTGEIATLYQLNARYDEALALASKLLEQTADLYGEEHLNVGLREGQLCSILLFQGEDARAHPHCQRRRDIFLSELGETHELTRTATGELATTLTNIGQLDLAIPLYRRNLELLPDLVGAEHPSVGVSLNNLASALSRQGPSAEATQLYRQALHIFETHHGERSRAAGWLTCNLANSLRQETAFEEASDAYRRCEGIFLEFSEENPELMAWPWIGQGRLAMAQDRPATAEPLFRRALEVRRAKTDVGRQRVAQAAGFLGDSLKALARFEDAEPLLQERFALYQQLYPAGHRDRQSAAEALHELYRDWPREAQATLAEEQLRAEEAAASTLQLATLP